MKLLIDIPEPIWDLWKIYIEEDPVSGASDLWFEALQALLTVDLKKNPVELAKKYVEMPNSKLREGLSELIDRNK